VNGLTSSLGVDVSVGLNEAQVLERAELFGKNEFPVQKTKSWMELFLESFEDTTLIVIIFLIRL
jgi:magnesium-transporting ATPase (P-type)